jgi:hypothetical protein
MPKMLKSDLKFDAFIGRIRTQRMIETTEETAAHTNRRIMKILNDEGGGRRNINVGV